MIRFTKIRSILPRLLWTVLSIAIALAVVPADAYFHRSLDPRPLLANVLAGMMLLPLEILVINAVLGSLLERDRKRRWSQLAAEASSAFLHNYRRYRELVQARYQLDERPRVAAAIDAADSFWRRLEEYETGLGEDWAEFRSAVEPAEFPFSNGDRERLDGVTAVWFSMWGAGVELDETALTRRVQDVSLGRIPADEPQVVQAMRSFSDAIDDLTDARRDLEHWESPFFYDILPDVGNTIPSSRIAINLASVSRDALRSLRGLIDCAARVVAAGDALVRLLPSPFSDADLRARRHAPRPGRAVDVEHASPLA